MNAIVALVGAGVVVVVGGVVWGVLGMARRRAPKDEHEKDCAE